MTSTSTSPDLHAVPGRDARQRHDLASARITQARAVVGLLQGEYQDPRRDRIADHVAADAIWAVVDLLDEAERALEGEGGGHE